jgi:ankyrin repeat protein
MKRLFKAIETNKIDTVIVMIRKGLYTTTLDELLIYAAQVGHIDIVNFFIDEGANINAQNFYGITPLMNASVNGHFEISKTLLEKGANIHTTAQLLVFHSISRNALMLAAGNGKTKVVKLLLDNGADIDSKDTYGTTALMFAAENGSNDTCELLIRRGADINATDFQGQTALMVAAEKRHTEIVELLNDNKDGNIGSKYNIFSIFSKSNVIARIEDNDSSSHPSPNSL